MERADAIRLIPKLRALADPKRGGTPSERAVAAAKAERLARRFGIQEHETYRRPAPRSRGFRAPAQGPAQGWAFDPNTGEASENVKVHRYDSRSSWKIEIPYGSLFGEFGRPRRKR